MARHVDLFSPVPPADVVAAKVQALRAAASTLSDIVLITDDQAGELIGARPALLARWRCAGDGPPYFKIGQHVRYELERVLAFVERRRAMLNRMAGAREADTRGAHDLS